VTQSGDGCGYESFATRNGTTLSISVNINLFISIFYNQRITAGFKPVESYLGSQLLQVSFKHYIHWNHPPIIIFHQYFEGKYSLLDSVS
jgi:hypothetical protein